jgi:hypothetical protein
MACFVCSVGRVIVPTVKKSKKFDLEPSVRYKRKTVEDHPDSQQQHKNALLHITVNGPDTSDCHHVIEEEMKEWLPKTRRKIAKYTDKQKEVSKLVTVDASVQVESQYDLDKIRSAYEEL